jgi:hypothetical protein
MSVPAPERNFASPAVSTVKNVVPIAQALPSVTTGT